MCEKAKEVKRTVTEVLHSNIGIVWLPLQFESGKCDGIDEWK